MQQASLFHDQEQEQKLQEEAAALAALLPMIRSSMNRVAEHHPVLSRDLIADRMTEISRSSGVKLTKGNAKSVKPATINKWLAPEDRDHPPSILALVAFCMATGDMTPIKPLMRSLGIEVMTEEDRKYRDYGRAIIEEREARKKKKKLEAEL